MIHPSRSFHGVSAVPTAWSLKARMHAQEWDQDSDEDFDVQLDAPESTGHGDGERWKPDEPERDHR